MSTNVANPVATNIQTARPESEKRAIKLLGSGLSASVVASAIGVSESRISQLMSMKDFSDEVSKLRYENLQKHNEMDDKYDQMESKVVKNLEELLPLMTRPMELLKAAQVLNQMKRRGSSAPDQMVSQNQVVQLMMPIAITQKFTTNVNNQVINAGNQTLETIQGSMLLNAAKNKHQQALSALPNNHVIENSVTNQNEQSKPSQQVIQQRVGALLDSKSSGLEQAASVGTATIYQPPVS